MTTDNRPLCAYNGCTTKAQNGIAHRGLCRLHARALGVIKVKQCREPGCERDARTTVHTRGYCTRHATVHGH